MTTERENNVVSMTPVADAIVKGETLLTLPLVESKAGIKKTEIYGRIKEGRFPRPLALGPNSVRWRESEIDAWIAALPRAQLLPRSIKK